MKYRDSVPDGISCFNKHGHKLDINLLYYLEDRSEKKKKTPKVVNAKKCQLKEKNIFMTKKIQNCTRKAIIIL